MLQRYALHYGCLHCPHNQAQEEVAAESASAAVWHDLTHLADDVSAESLLCPRCGTAFWSADNGKGDSAYKQIGGAS